MTGNTIHLSILTLDISHLNSPIKDTQCQVGLKSKTWPFVAYKKGILLTKTNIGLGWNDGKKIFQANGLWKQAGELYSYKIKTNTKQKLVKRDKESHFILIKGTVHQEEINNS
jgi:hypothetical protein